MVVWENGSKQQEKEGHSKDRATPPQKKDIYCSRNISFNCPTASMATWQSRVMVGQMWTEPAKMCTFLSIWRTSILWDNSKKTMPNYVWERSQESRQLGDDIKWMLQNILVWFDPKLEQNFHMKAVIWKIVIKDGPVVWVTKAASYAHVSTKLCNWGWCQVYLAVAKLKLSFQSFACYGRIMTRTSRISYHPLASASKACQIDFQPHLSWTAFAYAAFAPVLCSQNLIDFFCLFLLLVHLLLNVCSCFTLTQIMGPCNSALPTLTGRERSLLISSTRDPLKWKW